MKIIFDSKTEKMSILRSLACATICPKDLGLPELPDCGMSDLPDYPESSCIKCWKFAMKYIETEVRKDE